MMLSRRGQQRGCWSSYEGRLILWGQLRKCAAAEESHFCELNHNVWEREMSRPPVLNRKPIRSPFFYFLFLNFLNETTAWPGCRCNGSGRVFIPISCFILKDFLLFHLSRFSRRLSSPPPLMTLMRFTCVSLALHVYVRQPLYAESPAHFSHTRSFSLIHSLIHSLCGGIPGELIRGMEKHFWTPLDSASQSCLLCRYRRTKKAHGNRTWALIQTTY